MISLSKVISYYGRMKLAVCDDVAYAVADDVVHPLEEHRLGRGWDLPPGELREAVGLRDGIARVSAPLGARAGREVVAIARTEDGSIRLSTRNVAGALFLSASDEHEYVLAQRSPSAYVLKMYERGRDAECASYDLPIAAELSATRAGAVVSLAKGDVIVFDVHLRERWRLLPDPDWRLKDAFLRSLIVVNDVIVRNLGTSKSSKGGAVAAYSLADGTRMWLAEFPGEVSITEAAGRVYCAVSGRIWAIDASSGKRIVNGARVHEGAGRGDIVWPRGNQLWCASTHDQTLRRIESDSLEVSGSWKLPQAFAFSPFDIAYHARGWSYLRLITDFRLYRGGLGGILCIGPGPELSQDIQVEPWPRHRITRIREAGKDRYRIALESESMDELRRFGSILAKNIAQVRGASEVADERSNPAFQGRVEVAVPFESLGVQGQRNLQASFDVVADQIAAEYVLAGDGSRIEVRVVPLHSGELTGDNVSTTFEPPEVENDAPPAPASSSIDEDDVPDAITDALQGAKQDPAWRLGFAAVVLGGAALGDGFAERRERANEWLKQAYGEHADFAQEFIFNTGVLLTTPGVARRLWGSDEIEPKTVFEDFKRGVIQLAEWINARKLSVDEGLAVVKLLRALMAQLVGSGTGAKASKGKGVLGKLSGGGAKAIPKQAKPVFDAIEAALSEVERQLRQQS